MVAFREAARLNPAAIEARINLGRTLESVGRLDEAIDCLRLLLDDQPDVAAAHHHLGHALEAAERHEEAYEHFQRAVALDPAYAHALSSLGSAELRRGRRDEAIRRFRQALALRPEMHETYSNLLFILSSSDTLSPEELFEEHRRWGQQYGQVEAVFDHWQGSRDLLRKLPWRMSRPTFGNMPWHDSSSPFCDIMTASSSRCTAMPTFTSRTRRRSDFNRLAITGGRPVGIRIGRSREMIHADGIDVLIDLAGHTAGNQLLAMAYRPAPVQISWLGYPNTTGLPAIDYRITSEVQDPVGDESYHTEQLLRLPCGANCFAAPEAAPMWSARPASGTAFRRSARCIGRKRYRRPSTICGPRSDAGENPTARLLLFNTAFDRESTDLATRQLVDRGIRPERFEIRNATDSPHYLYTYGEIDIGLDVFPWNGGTTTREAPRWVSPWWKARAAAECSRYAATLRYAACVV